MQPELLPQLSSRNIASDQLHSAAQMVPVPANMFNSGSKYLVRWKTLLLLLVAYDAFVLPFEWTFIRLDRYTHCARYINLFIDVMFGLDILVHFNTARLINGSWVTNRTQLAWRYIRTWFVVDILSAIPFEIIFRLHIRWIKFVRIFGLLRVVKFSRVAHSIQAHFKLSTSVYRVIRFGW